MNKNYISTDLIFKIAKIFAVVPYYDFTKQKLTHTYLFKLHGLIMAGFTVLATLTPYYFLQPQHMSLHLKTLHYSVVMVMMSLLLVTILGSSFWNNGSWERLLTLLSHNEYSGTSNKRSFLKVSLLLFVGCLPGLFLFMYTAYLIGGIRGELMVIYQFTRHITLCLICNIISLVRDRYQNINDKFNDVNLCVVIKHNTIKTLREIGKIYLETDKIVDNFNAIFGLPLLFIYSEFVASILLSLAVVIERGLKLPVGATVSVEMTILNVFFNVTTLSGPVLLIFCSEEAVKDTEKLLKQCYTLYDLPLLPREKEELKKLQNLIENNPKFTAAGFFEIKKQTLLSLISTTTTYMIVILQFNLS